MSIVEVKVRFLKEKTKEELEEDAKELKILKVINGDDYVLPEINPSDKYSYEPAILNLKDVMFSNYIDPEHVCIRLHSGNMFVIKIKYDNYVEIYQKLTGYNVTLLYEETE